MQLSNKVAESEPVSNLVAGEGALDEFYDSPFFEGIGVSALQSAQEIVPLVTKLVKPRSVVDLGCGTGAFLAVFKENGAERVCGIDGDWVDRKQLLIPEEDFFGCDLAQPLPVWGHFDLAVSVEVAEHLTPEAGDALVESLTTLAPVVLFSAAIPHQGGVHHSNEQWPQYWVERFQARGFGGLDCLRSALWENKRVAWYYAQNLFLFVRKGHLFNVPGLRTANQTLGTAPVNVVHPTPWQLVNARCQDAEARLRELEAYNRQLLAMTPGLVSLKKTLGAIPSLVVHALSRRFLSR